jgi:hypothetical protein
MKNVIKGLIVMMIIGLTSCGSSLKMYESKTPSILPNNHGELNPMNKMSNKSGKSILLFSERLNSTKNVLIIED